MIFQKLWEKDETPALGISRSVVHKAHRFCQNIVL